LLLLCGAGTPGLRVADYPPGDLKINEVVDIPHVLVSMHIPKAIFR